MNKVLKICVAVAALAAFVVLPATASALNSARLTSPTGTFLNPGHAEKEKIGITATSVGILTMTGAGGESLISCATAELAGDLETNTHTAVEGTITTAKFFGKPGIVPHGTECKGSSGDTLVTTTNLPWCLFSNTTMATDEFQVKGGSCTGVTSAIKFTLHITTFLGTVSCNYENPKHLVGKYTTHPTSTEPAVLTITKQEFKTTSGGVCPEKGFLDQSFTLTGPTGQPVYIDKVT